MSLIAAGNIFDRGGIERVGRAARLRHGELGVDQIDRDDRIGAGKMRELHDVETDAADAEHHHGLADLDLGVVVDDARGRRHRATEQGRDLEVVVGGIRRHPIFGNDRIFVECRDPAGIEAFAAPLIGRRLALDALARPPMQHDGVAGLDIGHAGADFDHLR